MSEQNQAPLEWKTSAYEPHPAGYFEGRLTKWERTVSKPEFGSKPQVKLLFETDAEPEDGGDETCSISVWGTPTLSPRGWVGKYLMAVGVSIDDLKDKEYAKTFDLDEFLNIPVGITVVHEVDQKGEMRDKVAGFSQIKRKRRGQPAEQVAQVPAAAPVTAPARAAAHEQPRPAGRRRIADEDEEEQQAKRQPATTDSKDVFENE